MDGLSVSAEDFLRAVLEAAAQPILAVDPDGVIRFANPAAMAALGYDDASELSGRHSHETIHHQHSDGTSWFLRRDGTRFPVSYVSAPIEMPEGRGAVVAFTDIEDRLRAEQVLREHDAVLAAREASLRRIATLVAGGAASAEVFAAIAREVGHVIGLPLIAVWRYEPDGRTATVIGAWGEHPHPFQAGTRWPLDGPTICAQVLETGRPARIDDFATVPGTIADAARKTRIYACAGAPIIVDGEVWGVMSADSTDRVPLADDVESRLAEFTELVATVIANVESRAGLARLADEQAALRRVATLVARGAPPEELFAAVVEEIERVLGLENAGMCRYESDGTMTIVAISSGLAESFPVGGRWPLGGKNVTAFVLETGRSARIDSYDDASGPIGVAMRERDFTSSVGAPIVVQGRLWGVMIVSSTEQLLPADTELRLASFTEMVATAISNSDARMEASRLAEEQAALRRVATLVARGVPQAELFGAVTQEVGRLLGADLAGMIRYEPDTTVTPVAAWAAAGEHPELPSRWTTEDGDPAMLIESTRRAARVTDWTDVPGPIAAFIRDIGISSSVGSPIIVEGRLWGALAVHTQQPEPLPDDTESRLENFCDLVATAISNTEARTEVAASRARIVAATDEERRRVVRDLHDGAQQRLVHTILTLKLTQTVAQSGQAGVPTLLSEALDHVERANAELRDLAHGILPSALTQGGLRAGVDALASRMPVPVKIDVSVGRLPAAIEATAYFVVAEALTNVAKHAKATGATVRANVAHGTLSLQVRDDGIGGARPDGSGLVGLADRLSTLDGRLRVDSPAEGGTLVAAEIPSAA